MKPTDILAIGDITTDCFIRLGQAEVHCDLGKENCKLCMDFGSKIPYESVDIVRAVGNSANASVSAARLGLNSALLTYIGDDQNGKECMEELQKNNVDTEYVRTEAGKRTNYHYVLWYEVDRTILVKHEGFSYNLGKIANPKWIYLSSLGGNSLDFHNQIAEYLEKNPDVKLAFQPGTFQMKNGTQKLERIYAKLNPAELKRTIDLKLRKLAKAYQAKQGYREENEKENQLLKVTFSVYPTTPVKCPVLIT